MWILGMYVVYVNRDTKSKKTAQMTQTSSKQKHERWNKNYQKNKAKPKSNVNSLF